MNSKSSNPIKSTLTFTILGFLGPAISFFLLPIYLQYLTPDDYGILSLMIIFGGFASIVANLQLGAAMRTYYFDYSDQPELLKKYLHNIFTASLLIALIFTTLMLIIGPTFTELIFKDSRITFYPFGILAILGSIFNVCATPYLVYLKNGIRLKDFATYSISALLLTVGFQFYFIVVEGLGAVGALMGSCLSSLIIFLGIIISNKNLIRFQFDKKMIRDSITFSLPVIPFLFLNWFMLRGDRFFIERFLSLEKVGQYALLITILGLLFIIMNALDSAIRPFLFEAFKIKEKKKKEINGYLLFYIAMCLIVASGIILIGNHLHIITSNPDYLFIIRFFTLGTITVFLRIYVRLFNEQLYFVKQSKDVTYLSFITFIVLVLAYFIFVPRWEIWGALIALLIANIINAFIFYYQAQKRFRLNHNYKNLLVLPAFVFCIIILTEQLCYYFNYSRTIFGVAQFCMSLIVVYLFAYKRLKESIHFVN